jgi:hypothetical protein
MTNFSHHNLRLTRFLFVGLVLMIGIFQLSTLRPGHDWGDDFAQYILHARNLAAGKPYAETGYIFNPDHPNIGPVAYPPIFPLALAPLYAVAGLNLAAFKVLEVAILLLSLVAFAWLVRRELGWGASALLLVVLGFNPYLTDFKNLILSEYLFISLVFLSLAAFQWMMKVEKSAAWQWVGVGILVYLAYGVRSVALVLLPCFLLAEWVHTKRWPVKSVGAVLVAILGISLQAWAVPGTSSYLAMLKFDPVISLVLLRVYMEHLVEFWGIPADNSIALSLFVLFILSVWAYRLLRRRKVIDFFFISYLVVIILWSDYQGMRFILPLVYISGFYLFGGVSSLLRVLKTKVVFQTAVIVLLALVLLAGGLAKMAAAGFDAYPQGPETPHAQALFSYIRQQTQPQDRLVFFKPRAMALYTGRSCSGFDLNSDDQKFWARLAALKPEYVAAEMVPSEYTQYTLEGQRYYLEEFVLRYPNRFELVYQNQEFKLYRVLQ